MLTQQFVIFSIIGVVHCGWFSSLFSVEETTPLPRQNEKAVYISTIVSVNDNVTLTCSKQKKAKIKFYRENNLPLPETSYQENGKLIIPEINLAHQGLYICEYKTKRGKTTKRFFLSVHKKHDKFSTTEPPMTTIGSELLGGSNLDFDGCSNDTLHNGVCLGPASLFECHDGQKVNRSLRCNRKKDCDDGSDEMNCEFWPPKITRLPAPMNELFCATHDDDGVDMLRLECEFVGHPEPLIKWKKYEGHVPSKCKQISMNGQGILFCPNFTQSDQGAYSCVAENTVGTSESQPKSIAKCKNFISCNGFRVKNEEEIEHCLECYCSGKTDNCQNIKSKLVTSKIKFPDTLIDVGAKQSGEIILTPPEKSFFSVTEHQIIKYCELSNYTLVENSLLKSYGRNMQIPRYSGKVEFFPNAPDLIMQGNGVSLFYNSRVISSSSNVVNVRFWPGNWHHLNKTTATRQDIMLVLSDVDRFLFRCEYVKDNVENWSSNRFIHLESSIVADSSSSVSYVEKCNCPEGYTGLSCESCATGYIATNKKYGFTCEKIQCDEKNGYILSQNECIKSPCNINGSISLIPETDGTCRCKEGMTGSTCNQTVSCEAGHFRVEKSKECMKCWCSGVTENCNSSSLYRSEISSMSLGGYNSSNGRNFWLLPSIFSGNKLTSYGGHIKYAMKYVSGISKQEAPLTVELLTVNDVTLSFTHSNVDKSVFGTEKTWVVPMKETYWLKSDKTFANRSEFLTVLTKLKAVYIESPYHLSSGKVNLTWVRMSDAKKLEKELSFSVNDELAYEVEQCLCPAGYIGLSCESCDEGYYKEKNTSRCVKCDCDHCDPVEGCLSCPKGFYRDNPLTEMKPVCLPCDCNGREEKCGKDNNNNTFCLCQAGFTGLKCENVIAAEQNSSHLTIKISPSKLTNNVVGTNSVFNCSYSSGEKLQLSLQKIYGDREEGPFAGVPYETVANSNSFESAMTFNVELEEGLTEVRCLVHNAKGKEVGRVLATVESKGMQPVKITNCYSDYAYVKETKSKDLICLTAGSPKPTTTWYLKKANGSRERVDSVDGVHSLGPVSLTQNGTTYTCEAENSVGDKDICTVTLIVEQNCDVVHIIPKSLTVKEGETIFLQCRTTANSSVAWSHPSGFMPSFRSYEYNGNLTITDAQIQDAGNYSCSTKSTGNRLIQKWVWVNVTEKLISPTITISSRDAVIEVGQYFRVNCMATGKPDPVILWKKISGSDINNVHFNGGVLTIESAKLEDSGIYECEASSRAGKDVRQILIEVRDNRVAPKIDVNPSTLQPIEGHYAFVECRVLEGNPAPTVEWYKDSRGRFQFYRFGHNLEFMNITRYDTGIYQCVARNSVGQYAAYSEINVLFPPEITVSDTEITAYENDEISVKCSAVGNPLPKITWINQVKGKKRHLGDNDVLASLYLNQPEIKISVKASADLYGLICVATNDAGESRAVVPITVLPELVIEERDIQQVPIGSYHELLCDGCSGKLKWEKLNGPLVGDECDIPNGLMIPSVQIQHNATYVCKCSNNPKFQKSFGILVVGYVPKFTQDPKSYLVLPATLKSPNKVRIQMSFMTNLDNGVLLKDENNHLALSLQNRKLVLLMHSAHGKKHHFTSTVELQNGAWYSLMVDITPSAAEVILYDSNSLVLEEKMNHLKNTKEGLFKTEFINFFVGGTKSKNVLDHHTSTNHAAPVHMPSFDGCISRVVIDEKSYDLVKDGTYSTSVSLCKRCSEGIDHCRGEGKCLEAPTQLGFVCVCPNNPISKAFNCPPSCFGVNCDTQRDLCDVMNPCNRKDLNICLNKLSSLSCSCALGYEGLTCEKEEQSSFCVKGNGYVKLSSKHLFRSSLLQPEVIAMHFKLDKPKGLLLWRGDAENYLALTVNKGQVSYVYLNQGIELRVIALKKITLFDNHYLIAKRTNDSIVLQIDSEIYSDQSKFTTNRVNGEIYLGGAPDGVIPYHLKYSGLSGCIHSVSFEGKPNINFRENVLESVNINIRQSKLDSVSNKLRHNLAYDKMESESEDEDHDYEYNGSSEFERSGYQ